MKIEYPKMVYKTRIDYKIANSIEEQESLAEKGYGEYEVVVLGQKPESVVDVVIEETEQEKANKAETEANMENEAVTEADVIETVAHAKKHKKK